MGLLDVLNKLKKTNSVEEIHFNKQIEQFFLLYDNVYPILQSINNIYYCFQLSFDDAMPDINSINNKMKKCLSAISEIVSIYDYLDKYLQAHPKLKKDYEVEYCKMNKDINFLYQLTYSMTNNFVALIKRYPSIKEFPLIVNYSLTIFDLLNNDINIEKRLVRPSEQNTNNFTI